MGHSTDGWGLPKGSLEKATSSLNLNPYNLLLKQILLEGNLLKPSALESSVDGLPWSMAFVWSIKKAQSTSLSSSVVAGVSLLGKSWQRTENSGAWISMEDGDSWLQSYWKKLNHPILLNKGGKIWLWQHRDKVMSRKSLCSGRCYWISLKSQWKYPIRSSIDIRGWLKEHCISIEGIW